MPYLTKIDENQWKATAVLSMGDINDDNNKQVINEYKKEQS